MGQPYSQNIKTSTLLRRIFKARDISQFIESNAGGLSNTPFHFHLLKLCQIKGKRPNQIIKTAGIERTYGYQLFNGTRKPSRDKVLLLAFGFELDVEDTQRLLKQAQKSELYPKIMRDAVILYCLSHKKSVIETQDTLQRLGLTLLGGEEKIEG